MTGIKLDKGKPDRSLIPGDALWEVCRVFEFGAKKYDRWNWEKGFEWSRLLAAAQRHCDAIGDGIWLDEESGLPHAAHATCCLLMLLAHKIRGLGNDNLTRKSDTVVITPSEKYPTFYSSSGSCRPGLTNKDVPLHPLNGVFVEDANVNSHDRGNNKPCGDCCCSKEENKKDNSAPT
jgi:hypothetical protein